MEEEGRGRNNVAQPPFGYRVPHGGTRQRVQLHVDHFSLGKSPDEVVVEKRFRLFDDTVDSDDGVGGDQTTLTPSIVVS
jgi:hypothetical protein